MTIFFGRHRCYIQSEHFKLFSALLLLVKMLIKKVCSVFPLAFMICVEFTSKTIHVSGVIYVSWFIKNIKQFCRGITLKRGNIQPQLFDLHHILNLIRHRCFREIGLIYSKQISMSYYIGMKGSNEIYNQICFLKHCLLHKPT